MGKMMLSIGGFSVLFKFQKSWENITFEGLCTPTFLA